jgi:uncharacterized membrane protein YdbT with pleckstrin-like domain
MQKFHPSMVRPLIYGTAVFLIVFASASFFSSSLGGVKTEWWLIPAVSLLIGALAAAKGVAEALTTTYSLENGSLKMERGFISSESQVIPVKNIDNLRIKISVIGKFLSLADVYVDTPGGDTFEMVMTDVPQKAAEELADEVENLKKGA